MSSEWSARQAFRQPPFRVVNSAQRAFREHGCCAAGRLDLVFDSLADADDASTSPNRVLLFSTDAFDIVLTITRTARGNEVGGTAFARVGPLVVGVRRPMRATIAIPCTHEGRMRPTELPAGTASVVTRAPAFGCAWQSEW